MSHLTIGSWKILNVEINWMSKINQRKLCSSNRSLLENRFLEVKTSTDSNNLMLRTKTNLIVLTFLFFDISWRYSLSRLYNEVAVKLNVAKTSSFWTMFQIYLMKCQFQILISISLKIFWIFRFSTTYDIKFFNIFSNCSNLINDEVLCFTIIVFRVFW